MKVKNDTIGKVTGVSAEVNIKRYKKFLYKYFPSRFEKYVEHVKALGNPIHEVDYENQRIILFYKKG